MQYYNGTDYDTLYPVPETKLIYETSEIHAQYEKMYNTGSAQANRYNTTLEVDYREVDFSKVIGIYLTCEILENNNIADPSKFIDNSIVVLLQSFNYDVNNSTFTTFNSLLSFKYGFNEIKKENFLFLKQRRSVADSQNEFVYYPFYYMDPPSNQRGFLCYKDIVTRYNMEIGFSSTGGYGKVDMTVKFYINIMYSSLY